MEVEAVRGKEVGVGRKDRGRTGRQGEWERIRKGMVASMDVCACVLRERESEREREREIRWSKSQDYPTSNEH